MSEILGPVAGDASQRIAVDGVLQVGRIVAEIDPVERVAVDDVADYGREAVCPDPVSGIERDRVPLDSRARARPVDAVSHIQRAGAVGNPGAGSCGDTVPSVSMGRGGDDCSVAADENR